MITRNFHTHTVVIVDNEFKTHEGQIYAQTAEVTFFDCDGNQLSMHKFGYLPVNLIYEMIAQGEAIRINHCYIENFSLADFREQYNIEYQQLIPIVDFTCSHSLFEYHDKTIDLSNAEFESNNFPSIDLSNAIFLDSTNFSNSKFVSDNILFDSVFFRNGNVSFSRCIFSNGDVSFKNAVFGEGYKHFDDIEFGEGQISFINVEFSGGDVSFANTDFNNGRTSFKVARFGKGKTDFNHSRFGKGEVTFERSEFGDGTAQFRSAFFGEGKIDFTRAKFGTGEVSFINTIFSDGTVTFVDADFGDGDANFKLAEFGKGKIDFHFSKFGIGDKVFDKIIFGDGLVDFRGVDFGEGKLSFKHVDFGHEDISYEAIKLRKGKITFRRSTFGRGTLNFEMLEMDTADILFEGVNFIGGKTTFFGAKINKLEFQACQLSDHFDLQMSQCNFLNLSDSVIRDIVDFNSQSTKVNIKSLNLIGIKLLGRIYINWVEHSVRDLINNQNTTWRNKSEQFRVLKQNFYTTGQYNEEDLAYVEFKRTELKANTEDAITRNERNKFWAYPSQFFQWLIFDRIGLYATNPVRVLFSVLIAYISYSLFYVLISLIFGTHIISSLGDPEGLSLVSRCFYFSAVTFFTIGYGDFYPGGFLKFFAGVEGFTGVFMMSYFTVAFVRKILR